VVLTWFVIGRGTVWWIRRHAEPLIAEDWIELTGMVSAEVGIGRKVTFLKSPSTAVAIADGIRKASVILPACSEGWDRERRRVVLLHELTHIRRMDGLFELIAQAALILQWFNPLVWVAVRQHKRERERACDDAVLISGTKPSTYAYHLMEVAKDMSMNRTGLLRAATVSQATSLKDRLLCILNPGLDRNPQGRTRAAAAAVAILVTVVPLAAVQPWPAHRQQSEIENPISNKSFRNNQAPGPGSSLSKLAKILPPLADDDGEAHRQAAEALRSMNSEEVIAALIDALDDDSADVRRQAIVALEHLRAKRAVPHLIEALRDKDGSVRKHAAIALEHIPTVDAVPALVDALADMEPEVRHASVVALEHIRSRDAVPALIGALSDPHPEVRRSAAYALEKIRDRRALAALAHTMANDSDSRVRQAAAHALGRIK
jgi:HEAT repeat protein